MMMEVRLKLVGLPFIRRNVSKSSNQISVLKSLEFDSKFFIRISVLISDCRRRCVTRAHKLKKHLLLFCLNMKPFKLGAHLLKTFITSVSFACIKLILLSKHFPCFKLKKKKESSAHSKYFSTRISFMVMLLNA